ncbi:hypothetical protein PENTCL1PPCAC_5494 [Pristionchus entomophagus]|uniref:glutathione transferase n=1 Tax=Pristionchus entomophagus TaxID=358040 RepID=A0AAV5SSZ6_9BILA|nr:hypothetical protein PENTCL1PPCAC_5494 [Pristionchus entomophagus]
MPKYELYYFAIRGLGEVPRQLLALAGVEYTNIRVEDEAWEEGSIKRKMPFGQMPVLFIDDKPLPQSLAINRYLAKLCGLAGKTPFETALVDAMADLWKDFNDEFEIYWDIKLGWEEGDVKAAKTRHAVPAVHKFFPMITKTIKESRSGFLVGDSLTWVDVLVANYADEINLEEPALIADYPEILAHKERIHAIHALKKWIKNRE